MQKIIPISELRNTSKINDLCVNSKDPIYITKNGYGEMVIMNIQVFQTMQEELQMYKDIAQTQRDIKNGDCDTLDNVIKRLKTKYDL